MPNHKSFHNEYDSKMEQINKYYINDHNHSDI